MVVFDATTLLFVLSANVAAPLDSKTGKPLNRAKERVDFLLAELEKRRTKIIVPTPALAEILVRAAAAGPGYLQKLTTSAHFKIVAFEERAAVEVSVMTAQELKEGIKRAPGVTFAKLKYDRQIVAIARVEGAAAIYSDDEDMKTLAARAGIPIVRLEHLPLPPEEKPPQPDMFGKDAPANAEKPADHKSPPAAPAGEPAGTKPTPAVQGQGGGTPVRPDGGAAPSGDERPGEAKAADSKPTPSVEAGKPIEIKKEPETVAAKPTPPPSDLKGSPPATK